MVEWLMSYKLKAYLQADIVSGFTVGIMNIPQGMGYALLASLPPVGGLYISFFPLIIYAIFGTSRHLAIGSIAIVSLLSGGVVDAMVASHGPFLNEHGNGTDTDALNAFKFKVVCSLSLLVGILQVDIFHIFYHFLVLNLS
jgi:MFS superfamily sulfate permease-like transporter